MFSKETKFDSQLSAEYLKERKLRYCTVKKCKYALFSFFRNKMGIELIHSKLFFLSLNHFYKVNKNNKKKCGIPYTDCSYPSLFLCYYFSTVSNVFNPVTV